VASPGAFSTIVATTPPTACLGSGTVAWLVPRMHPVQSTEVAAGSAASLRSTAKRRRPKDTAGLNNCKTNTWRTRPCCTRMAGGTQLQSERGFSARRGPAGGHPPATRPHCGHTGTQAMPVPPLAHSLSAALATPADARCRRGGGGGGPPPPAPGPPPPPAAPGGAGGGGGGGKHLAASCTTSTGLHEGEQRLHGTPAPALLLLLPLLLAPQLLLALLFLALLTP